MNKLNQYLSDKEVSLTVRDLVMPALKERDHGAMAIALFQCAKAYGEHLKSQNHPDAENIKALIDVVKQISGNFLKARRHLTAEFMDCAEEMLRAQFCNRAIAELNEQTN